jgi:hypothetical protein
MIKFFVLDEAGDHELAFELDDYGEESYYIPDKKSSVADSNIKKLIEIETFDHTYVRKSNKLAFFLSTCLSFLSINFSINFIN